MNFSFASTKEICAAFFTFFLFFTLRSFLCEQQGQVIVYDIYTIMREDSGPWINPTYEPHVKNYTDVASGWLVNHVSSFGSKMSLPLPQVSETIRVYLVAVFHNLTLEINLGMSVGWRKQLQHSTRYGDSVPSVEPLIKVF